MVINLRMLTRSPVIRRHVLPGDTLVCKVLLLTSSPLLVWRGGGRQRSSPTTDRNHLPQGEGATERDSTYSSLSPCYVPGHSTQVITFALSSPHLWLPFHLRKRSSRVSVTCLRPHSPEALEPRWFPELAGPALSRCLATH